MKRKMMVLFLILVFLLAGCSLKQQNTEVDKKNKDITKEIYYAVKGSWYKLNEDNLLLNFNDGLEIIDLDTKKVIKKLHISPAKLAGFDIYGNKVVWSAIGENDPDKDAFYDKTADTNIYLYDIKDDTIKQITTNTAGQVDPKIWQNYIVWQDNRNTGKKDKDIRWDIYLYNISTKEETRITTEPGNNTNPDINDNKIVWEDGRNYKDSEGNLVINWSGGGNFPKDNSDIYLYDIKTGKERAIATRPLQECNPYVTDNYVVWEDRNDRGIAAEIYLYDLKKDKTVKITDDEFNQRTPQIYGHYMVWMDERNGNSSDDVVDGTVQKSDIFLYDINSKKEFLMTGKEPQISPNISKTYIVYETVRQMNAEIQVFKYK